MEALVIYGSLFASAFLAAIILPISSEAVLAALLAAGCGDPALLIVVGTIGNMASSVLNWALGRGIDKLQTSRRFPVTRERFEKASLTFRRFGVWTLPFAWLPIVWDAFTVAAGAARVHLGLFVLLVGLGKAARYAAIVAGTIWLTG